MRVRVGVEVEVMRVGCENGVRKRKGIVIGGGYTRGEGRGRGKRKRGEGERGERRGGGGEGEGERGKRGRLKLECMHKTVH